MDEKVIKDLLKQHFKDPNTKINKEALSLYCHLLELFVREGVLRAQNQAKEEGNSEIIEFEHLERVFVQLLLDF